MRHLFRILGVLLCALPPTVSTLAFLPIWFGGRETALPALTLILCALTAPLLLWLLKAHLRVPPVWMLWLGLWAVLFLFAPILPALKTIALVSFPTALLGDVCFSVCRRLDRQHEGG